MVRANACQDGLSVAKGGEVYEEHAMVEPVDLIGGYP
jgi:hypothetical protein